MTDNEITKALECCCDTTEIDCSEECPLYNHSGECWGAIKYDVFNIINRQKEEIERLVAVVEKTDAAYFQKVDEVDRLKAKIERLNNKYVNLMSKIEHLTGV